MSRVYLAYDPSTSSDTLKDVANALWDVDETDRFVKLALHYPDLLGHEEQRLWKLIRECGFVARQLPGSRRGMAVDGSRELAHLG